MGIYKEVDFENSVYVFEGHSVVCLGDTYQPTGKEP